jgi:hypothetical protein
MKRTTRNSLNGDTVVYYTHCKDLKELRRIKYYYSEWNDVTCAIIGRAAVVSAADNKRKGVRLT